MKKGAYRKNNRNNTQKKNIQKKVKIGKIWKFIMSRIT